MTKRRDVIKELEAAGFVLVPNSNGSHDKYSNGRLTVPVPRHREIPEGTVHKIRRDAGLLR